MAAACRSPLLHHLPSPPLPFPKPRFLLPSSPLGSPSPNPRNLALRSKPPASASSKSAGSGGGVKKEQKLNQEGVIVEALPNCMFRVRLDATGDVILGYMSGKMQKNKIFIVTGDRVQVEIGRYDSTRGRITFRYDRRSNRAPPKSNNNKDK